MNSADNNFKDGKYFVRNAFGVISNTANWPGCNAATWAAVNLRDISAQAIILPRVEAVAANRLLSLTVQGMGVYWTRKIINYPFLDKKLTASSSKLKVTAIALHTNSKSNS